MTHEDIILPTEPARELPAVRSIGPVDLRDALAKGLDDFWAMPTHVVFLSLIYPIVGIALGSATFGYDVIPLLFPLAAGFDDAQQDWIRGQQSPEVVSNAEHALTPSPWQGEGRGEGRSSVLRYVRL